MAKRLTSEEFICKAKEIHGDKYDYSKVNYINSKTSVCVICKEHGEFITKPNYLLMGHGCRKCANEHLSRLAKERRSERPKTPKERKISKRIVPCDKFISMVKEKCDNKFTINEETFKNMSTNVEITCNNCGNTFKRKPTYFINYNQTCPYCNGLNRNRKYTTEEFVARSKELFNRNDWSYEETEYKSTDEKVKIHCHALDEFGEEHGVFEVTPHAHIGSMHSGCPKCSKKYHYGKDYLIKRLENMYGNLFTFEKMHEFKNMFEDIIVTCKYHGDFTTKPYLILSGRGCPKCSQSSLEQMVSSFLEDNKIEYIFQANRKTFPWLDKQSLDFYLPKLNIAIECQGEQHFKPVEHFNKKRTFELMLEMDEIKKKRCLENGLNLLYFTTIKKYVDNREIFDFEHIKEKLLKNNIYDNN